jgi:N-acetylglucosaminyldiphosphoundecaprenol N-acetyl-beta-D-mannosaminyltransferase
MVLVDGRPVLWASRLLGCAVPGVVPGSDLVPCLFDHIADAGGRMSVYLLGAAPGVAQRAASVIHERWPGIAVVGTSSPPVGFEAEPRECEKLLAAVSAVKPDILIVGLGAPKQERWIHANRYRIDAKVALCVGAAIDFLAGEKPRAPPWMREHGLEWMHRVACEPRRLSGRYVRDAFVFPGLLIRELASTRSDASARSRSSRSPASPAWAVTQIVSRIDAALGRRSTRLLQFLGTSWNMDLKELAFAYADISARLRQRRVLLVSAEDAGLERGVLDCLRHGQPLQGAIRSISGTVSYATLRGGRALDYATQAMIADGALWTQLRNGFDEVVVTSRTPHASQFGLVVASNVDAVMVVIDAKRTRVSSARDILDDLRAVRANVLGTVMSA